ARLEKNGSRIRAHAQYRLLNRNSLIGNDCARGAHSIYFRDLDGHLPELATPGRRAQARLAQKLFYCRRQDSGVQRHEEFSERAAATVMTAYGPRQTWANAPHMSAFGGKADMVLTRRRTLFVGKSVSSCQQSSRRQDVFHFLREISWL